MRILFEEYEIGQHLLERPWVLVGKGPTFGNHIKAAREFPRMGLNQAAGHILPWSHTVFLLGHAIDVDTIESLDVERRNRPAAWLVPEAHHRGCMDSPEPFDLGDDAPPCVVYPLVHEMDKIKDGEIAAVSMSSAAALCILGKWGVKQVYTAGIDGGGDRHENFKNPPGRTYDDPQTQLREVVEHYGMEVTRL